MKKISVLLAEDHVVVREGLRFLLSVENDIKVVGEAGNGRQAVQMARELRPDVVVMDISMPILNGLEATCRIVAEGIPSKVLILSSFGDDEYVHKLTEAGASGYLVKHTAAGDLIKAVREVSRGNLFFSPSILKRLVELYRESSLRARMANRRSEHLTSREQEVLQMVAEGHASRQIASVLCISFKTVDKHRQQLMDKLDIHDVAGLTRYAVAHGVIECASRERRPGRAPAPSAQDERTGRVDGARGRLLAAPVHP
jgi:DNA-binding NarL/FixJ family response regulator